MKNNKFDKDAGIFCVGIVLCAIGGLLIAALNYSRQTYKTVYDACKNGTEIAECKCLARCIAKNHGKSMLMRTDSDETCLDKCL